MSRAFLWLMAAVLMSGLVVPVAAQDEPPADSAAPEETTEAAEESESGGWSFQAFMDEAHSLGTVTITVGPDSMRLDWDGLQLGEQASSAVRSLADGAMSDEADGTVTDAEASDFLVALQVLAEREFRKIANHHDFGGFVLIDQAEAGELNVDLFEADGLAGDVDEGGPITVTMGLAVEFPNLDKGKDIHTVTIDLGDTYLHESEDGSAATMVGDLTLVVQPVADWTMDLSSVAPDCAFESYQEGKLVFTGDDAQCFTERSGILLSFAITGEGVDDPNFLPGWGLVAAVSGLGLGARLRRRFE